jgi:transcriptional regulator with XRE-family HTH domain
VRSSLERQLGTFLRKKRGEQTFAQFARKLGIPPSTLHRLENGEQSITLGKLEQVMRRLNCKLSDIFEK